MKKITLDELSAETVSRFGVVCVPTESPPNPDSLIEIAQRVGKPVPFGLGKYQTAELPREITVLDNLGDGVTAAPRSFGEGWHQDSSFLPSAPAFTMLLALDVPSSAGETLFADTRAGLSGASESELADLANISLLHSVGPTYRIAPKDIGKSVQELCDSLPRAQHPLLFNHPIAGNTLLISPLYTSLNLQADTKHIVDSLLDKILRESFSHNWTVGDIVVWDNRVVLHCAPGYAGVERRRLMRVVIEEGCRQQ